jgi:hypothetical protein
MMASDALPNKGPKIINEFIDLLIGIGFTGSPNRFRVTKPTGLLQGEPFMVFIQTTSKVTPS